MANNIYANSNTAVGILKELYSPGPPDNASEEATASYPHLGNDGYFYASKFEAVMSETNTRFIPLKNLVYSKNPFLSMIKPDPFQGVYLPVPIKVED